jgi:parallel beta-helix repeat protein
MTERPTNGNRSPATRSPAGVTRWLTLRRGIILAAAALVVTVPALMAAMSPGRDAARTSQPPGTQVAEAASGQPSPANTPAESASASGQPAGTAPPGSSVEPEPSGGEGSDPPSATPTVGPSPGGGGTAHTPAPTIRPTATPPLVVGDLYVATDGSDANPGTIQRPLRTPARAAAIAGSGSTVYLRSGTYGGFDVTRSGITFTSYPGETAVVSDASRPDVIEFSGVSSGAVIGVVVQGSTTTYGSGIKIDESSGVTVSQSTIRDNKTFGIVVVRSSNVHLDGNTITGNADGIEERYAGNGLAITNNRIHGNTKMVDSGRGKEGINFYKSTGSVTVTGNLLWDNGTHFEVYGASNLNISGNVTWNGQIMETGTDGPACDNNRFTRNIGFKGSGFQGGSTNGMILRCASNMLVAHNTLDGFDLFAFDVVDGTQGVAYGGSIQGLRIVDNIAVGGRAFSIDSALPTSVVIDYNLLYNVGSTAQYGNHLAYVKNVGNLDTLDAFRGATGYEQHGVFGDPLFIDGAGADYHLKAGSPAIDAGTVVLSGGYAGAAPDMGRYEAG